VGQYPVVVNIFFSEDDLTWEKEDAAMSLSDKDKAVVKALWSKISSKADEIGAEALGR